MKNINNLIVGCLNINSIQNKFDQLRVFLGNDVDILVLIETKIDASFPTNQFCLPGYCKPFRHDRNIHGGGILIYVKEGIPCKPLEKHATPDDMEGIFIELNFRKSKWLFGGIYSPKQSDNYFFEFLGNTLDKYGQIYDNFLVAGDFNTEETAPVLSKFLKDYDAENLVKEKTCFKSLINPTCIDLFITNSQRKFQNTTTICTGLSDFHKMIITSTRGHLRNINKPKIIKYRDYKCFIHNDFKSDLTDALLEYNVPSYEGFEKIFLSVLNKHAPIKNKTLRANHVPYMTKALRKAIMRRSELKTKYLKSNTVKSFQLYKKHKNFCSKLYKKERKKYYNNLNLKNITDNKKFWTTVKPFLSDKGSAQSQITLVDEDKVLSNDKEVAETFNCFFENAVKSLELSGSIYSLTNTGNLTDPVEKAIKRFEKHPSILAIKENINPGKNYFNFFEVTHTELVSELNQLDPKKSGLQDSIPSKILKESSDLCAKHLMEIWNKEILQNKNFSKALKLADITPVFKKGDATLSKNYRPVSVLPSASKIFERLIQKQLFPFIEGSLSSSLCGYRKKYSTQTALVSLVEKWKKMIDEKGYAGAILMDLSKAFDTINHELLIAKLCAYGIEKSSLDILYSYLSDRWQRTKVNNAFSSWTELETGVPQGSVLGPMLFNIYLNDLFFFLERSEVCNYADDTTPYVCDVSLKGVLFDLEHELAISEDWFLDNFMKLNTDKCHLFVSGHKYEHCFIKNHNSEILWEKNHVRLLGVDLDSELKFDTHVSNICAKASKKLNILKRLSKFLNFSQKRLIFKSFFESQFKYCPLIWMFHSRALNSRINRLHERALRIIYDDYDSSFESLLYKDGSFTVHECNIQTLAIELYKVANGISNSGLSDILTLNNSYQLRSNSNFSVPLVRTERYGKGSIRYFGPLLWGIVPEHIKMSPNEETFKSLIKKWKPKHCPCRLCKEYIADIGFL